MYVFPSHLDNMFYRTTKVKKFSLNEEVLGKPLREEFRFPMMMLRLLGVMPLRTTNSGKAEMKILSPIMLYSTIVAGVMTVGILIIMKERYSLLFGSLSFADRVLEAASFIFVVPALLVPYTHWFECDKKANFVNNFQKFQLDFQKVTGKPLLLDMTMTIRKVKVSVVLIVFVFTTLIFLSGRGFTWWQGIPFAYSVCLCAITTGGWCAMTKALGTLSQKIMMHLKQNMKQLGYNCGEKMHEFKNLWLSLSYLTQECGSALGYSYICHIIVYFVQQVLAIYGFLAEMDGFTTTRIGFIVSVIMFTYAIFMICSCAHRATDEVGNQFKKDLQELEERFTSGVYEARYEIKLFLDAIATNPPIINLCGFVDVNRGLITSLMGAMVTYLIVLIQFQMNTREASNVTSST